MVLLAGGAKVTAIDPVPEKRELALSMGAEYVLDPFHDNLEERSMEITDGNGFDHVFEVSGSPKAANVCLDIVAHCGKVTYFAVFPPKYEMPLNLYKLYMKEASIQTVFTSHYLFPRAINLMPRVQTDKIIGKVLPLSQALEAFELFKESRYPKILLECGID
jgi:threonine dehydrogenase-like Zn-dependent dehydrogenase